MSLTLNQNIYTVKSRPQNQQSFGCSECRTGKNILYGLVRNGAELKKAEKYLNVSAPQKGIISGKQHLDHEECMINVIKNFINDPQLPEFINKYISNLNK